LAATYNKMLLRAATVAGPAGLVLSFILSFIAWFIVVVIAPLGILWHLLLDYKNGLRHNETPLAITVLLNGIYRTNERVIFRIR